MLVSISRSKIRLNLIDRFNSKIIKTGNCWEWISLKSTNNYGIFRLNNKNYSSHRLSYELYKGKIPEGLVIDHLCKNTLCVNPDHLEAVTQKINLYRGNTVTLNHSKKTHCPQGHEYSGKNLYLYEGSRYCKTCRDNNVLKHKEKNNEK